MYLGIILFLTSLAYAQSANENDGCPAELSGTEILIYISMPFISGFVGWFTNVIALKVCSKEHFYTILMMSNFFFVILSYR